MFRPLWATASFACLRSTAYQTERERRKINFHSFHRQNIPFFFRIESINLTSSLLSPYSASAMAENAIDSCGLLSRLLKYSRMHRSRMFCIRFMSNFSFPIIVHRNSIKLNAPARVRLSGFYLSKCFPKLTPFSRRPNQLFPTAHFQMKSRCRIHSFRWDCRTRYWHMDRQSQPSRVATAKPMFLTNNGVTRSKRSISNCL